jgi:hypothetical protein
LFIYTFEFLPYVSGRKADIQSKTASVHTCLTDRRTSGL